VERVLHSYHVHYSGFGHVPLTPDRRRRTGGRRVHRRRRFRRRRNLRVSSPIDTSAVTNPAPQQVYQTERFGNFTYTVPNLTPGSQYTVQLDFAELYWSAANQRLFNVAINGQIRPHQIRHLRRRRWCGEQSDRKVIHHNRGLQRQDRHYLYSLKDNAKVDGIEITPTGSPHANTGHHSHPLQIDSGRIGKRRVPRRHRFQRRRGYGVPSAIDTSAVTNPAPQSVIRPSARHVLLPDSQPDARCSVHGQARFRRALLDAVTSECSTWSINNTQVLSSFDIIKAAGAKNKAIAETSPRRRAPPGDHDLFTSVKRQRQSEWDRDTAQITGPRPMHAIDTVSV